MNAREVVNKNKEKQDDNIKREGIETKRRNKKDIKETENQDKYSRDVVDIKKEEKRDDKTKEKEGREI